MLRGILNSIGYLVILALLWSWFAAPAMAERVWDDELNRYLTPEELGQEDVFLTPDDAAKLMFPHSERIRKVTM